MLKPTLTCNRKTLTTLCCKAIAKRWNEFDAEAVAKALPSELYALCRWSKGTETQTK